MNVLTTMNRFFGRLNFFVLLFSFALLFLSFMYAAVSYRPLADEGPMWFYAIIGFHHPTIDPQFTRYTDVALIQLPAILFLKIFGSTFNADAVDLLSFLYTMHPFFSLVICFAYLYRKERLDLLFFSLFSVLFASVPTLALSIGMAALSLSVFWPLFYLVLLEDRPTLKHIFFILVGLVALLFSYEPAFLLFGLLAVVTGTRTIKNRSWVSFDTFIFAFSLFSTAYLISVIRNTNVEVLKNYWIWIYTIFDKLRIFGFAATVTFFGYAFSKSRSLFYPAKFFGVCLVAVNLGFLFYLVQVCRSEDILFEGAGRKMKIISQFGPTTAFPARATAVPFAFVLALACMGWFVSTVKQKASSILQNSSVIAAVSFIIVLSSFADYVSTRIWARSLNEFTELVLSQKSCTMLSGEEYEKRFHPAAINHFSIPQLSIMVQIIKKKPQVESLLFLDESYRNPEFKNICSQKKNATYPGPAGPFLVASPHIRFLEELK